jgi:hypothetical protein
MGYSYSTDRLVLESHVSHRLLFSTSNTLPLRICRAKDSHTFMPRRMKRTGLMPTTFSGASSTPEDSNLTRTNLFDSYLEHRKDESKLTLQECKEQIRASFNAYQSTTVLVDALDEIEQDSRYDLVTTLNTLASEFEGHIKIFLSSRPDLRIESMFPTCSKITIEASNNEGDIKTYLNARVDKEIKQNPVFKKLKV